MKKSIFTITLMVFLLVGLEMTNPIVWPNAQQISTWWTTQLAVEQSGESAVSPVPMTFYDGQNGQNAVTMNEILDNDFVLVKIIDYSFEVVGNDPFQLDMTLTYNKPATCAEWEDRADELRVTADTVNFLPLMKLPDPLPPECVVEDVETVEVISLPVEKIDARHGSVMVNLFPHTVYVSSADGSITPYPERKTLIPIIDPEGCPYSEENSSEDDNIVVNTGSFCFLVNGWPLHYGWGTFDASGFSMADWKVDPPAESWQFTIKAVAKTKATDPEEAAASHLAALDANGVEYETLRYPMADGEELFIVQYLSDVEGEWFVRNSYTVRFGRLYMFRADVSTEMSGSQIKEEWKAVMDSLVFTD